MKTKLREQHSKLNFPVYLQSEYNIDNSSLSPPLATLPACFNANLGRPPRRGYRGLDAHAVFGPASEAASKDAN